MLEVDTLDGIEIDVLFDVLNPENPLERIVYRKKAAQLTTNRLEFVKMNNNFKQVATEKTALKKYNPIISFKHLSYSVIESAKMVEITLEKHIDEDVSVYVRTRNDTAK